MEGSLLSKSFSGLTSVSDAGSGYQNFMGNAPSAISLKLARRPARSALAPSRTQTFIAETK
jgi:hypothetical protein